MDKLTTPKEVFTYIRDESLGHFSNYICNCIVSVTAHNFALEDKCRKLLEFHKPKTGSFTKHKYWHGEYAWWLMTTAEYKDDLPELMEEKRRFLTHLIEKL